MTDIFAEDLEDLELDDPELTTEEEEIQSSKIPTLDARRRLENLLEERRLREELEDFADF